jgi:hypothetical protein
MLDRETIRKAIRGPIKVVNVSEWGGDIGIRTLSAADLIRLRQLTKDKPDEVTPDDDLAVTCELLAMAICGEDGAAVFMPDELREWSGRQMDLITRLVEEVQEHNGIGTAQREELGKNSESGQTSDST